MHMKRSERRELADSFLKKASNRLQTYSFEEISEWPDYPEELDVNLCVPESLREYRFTPMKDTMPDGGIRVSIQRYRKIFWAYGEITADGFTIYPDGKTKSFTDEDRWDVT